MLIVHRAGSWQCADPPSENESVSKLVVQRSQGRHAIRGIHRPNHGVLPEFLRKEKSTEVNHHPMQLDVVSSVNLSFAPEVINERLGSWQLVQIPQKHISADVEGA